VGNNLCEYGCGAEATYQMKNGKWCCEKSVSKCCEVRRKNSESSKVSIGNKSNLSKYKQSGKVWNRGRTKETDKSMLAISEKLKEGYASGKLCPSFLGKHHTKETILKLSKMGGIRKGSGRGRKGWYKGYYCDSTWELAYVVYNIDHDVKFARNNVGFDYEHNCIKHKFYPDFKMEDGSYVEVKGWLDKQNLSKIEQFNGGTLVLLGKSGIKPYLEYVVSKYGTGFVNLYDNYCDDRLVCSCGKVKSKKALKCRGCASIDRGRRARKTERPTVERLSELVANFPMTKIGEMFGVSDNCIRKWCKAEGIM